MAITKSFYWLLFSDDETQTPIAKADSDWSNRGELITEITSSRKVPFQMTLKNRVEYGVYDEYIEEHDDTWLDIQPNDQCWLLLSERLMNAINSNLSGKEGVYWVSVLVKSPNQSRTYYIACFEQLLDTLNVDKTKIYGSLIPEPVFSATKVEDFEMLNVQPSLWEIPLQIYISGKIKRIIDKGGFKGLNLHKAKVE